MSTAQVSIYIKRNKHKDYFQVCPLLRARGVAALKLPACGELQRTGRHYIFLLFIEYP